MSQPLGDEALCAIFIHAGAGFHSHENEHKHLKACEVSVAVLYIFDGYRV
jgi:taspase (threonine aspartase 1)